MKLINKLTLKQIDRIITLLIILIVLCIIYLFYLEIYAPAKSSVGYQLGEFTEEELEEKGIYLIGYYEPSSKNITIIDDRNGKTLKHESCHKSQDIKGKLCAGCGNKNQLLMNEIECKISEFMPMFIYEKIYGKV